MLFASWNQVPVYSLIIEAGVTALLGGKTVFVAAQYAQAANQTENKSKLSKRYAILTACLSGAIFVSGMLSPFLMKFMSLIYLQLLGEIVTTVCFFATLFLYLEPDISKKNISIISPAKSVEPKKKLQTNVQEIIPQKKEVASSQPAHNTVVYTINSPKTPPKLSIVAENDSENTENESLARRRAIDMSPTCLWKPSIWPETPPTPPENVKKPKPKALKKFSTLLWLKKLKEVYYLAWQTLTKKRTSHSRCHLFTWCIVGLIYSCADSGMDTVTALYVYHEPLSWTPSGYSLWMASMNVVQMLISMTIFRVSNYKQERRLKIIIAKFHSFTGMMILPALDNRPWSMAKSF
uniref:Uncharacterized protein n=1 Tax=Romanomermis culicivorax TaxID=13658 RepID=A0A915IXK7_ROMCU